MDSLTFDARWFRIGLALVASFLAFSLAAAATLPETPRNAPIHIQPGTGHTLPTRPASGYAHVVFTADGVHIGGHVVPWGGQVTLTDSDALQFFPGDGACRYVYGGQAVVNQGTITSGTITLQNWNDNQPPSGVMIPGLAPGQIYRVPDDEQWAFKPGTHVLYFSASTANTGSADRRSITIHVAGPCQPRIINMLNTHPLPPGLRSPYHSGQVQLNPQPLPPGAK